MDIGVKLEPVNLSNIGGGALEEHFQKLLKEASDIFDNSTEYESSKGDVSCKMSFAVELVYNEPSQTISVYVRGTMKKPSRKAAGRGLYRQNNKFFVYDEPTQQTLFTPKKPAPLRAVED